MTLKLWFKELGDQVSEIYQQANQHSGGRLAILKTTFQNFSKNRVSRAAAGMTYYALFSLFPLLIVLATVGSFFVEGEAAISKIAQVMTTVIPVSNDLVRRNIQRVVDLRGSVGVLGLAGFAWSASNAFALLSDHINQAFPATATRSFLRKRLVALGILVVIVVTLVLVMLSSTTLRLLSQDQLQFLGGVDVNSWLWPFVTDLSLWFISFLLFFSLYRWVPNTTVHWKAALWSALVVTILWQVTSTFFRWYLGSGLANYELVYGSLSAVVLLLLWVYISSLVLFWGAHLCGAVNVYIQQGPSEQEGVTTD